MGRRGFTLVELLVALAILGVLFLVAMGAMGRFLEARSRVDAQAGLQGKLRRIVEVFTQDLRGAAFGGIGTVPYPSGRESISFALLEGGAGYPVRPLQGFPQAGELTIVALGTPGLEAGDQVLLVNAGGEATVLPVASVNQVEQGLWQVVHAGCANTIPYTPNTLLFRVQTLGFRFDPQSGTLFARQGLGEEVPVAFRLSGFRIDYVYEDASGNPEVNPSFYNWDNPTSEAPPPMEREGRLLKRLVLRLEATEDSRGQRQRVAYSSAVELPSTGSYDIRSLRPCERR